MLKKLVYIASILIFAGSMTASAEGLTPLQRKVRDAFASIHASEKARAVKAASYNFVEEQDITTESEEQNHSIEAMAAEDSTNYDNVILATDQDDEVVTAEGEDDEFVVIHAPKKHKKNAKVKTAAEASSNQRTAKINKNWRIEALGWKSKLTGHVKIATDKSDPASGEKIDLERDTNGVDKKTVPGFKLSYKANKRSTLDFSWVKVDQDGTLNFNRKFKGVEYSANAKFDINNSMFDLAWNYRLSHNVEASGREKSYLSAILGVKSSKMEFRLNGIDSLTLNPRSEEYSKTLPVPYVGLEFGSYLSDDLYFKATARYLSLNNIKDYDVKHCDYDVALSYKVNSQNNNSDLFIDLGYRQVVYDVDGDGNDVELRYKGPYVGIEYLF